MYLAMLRLLVILSCCAGTLSQSNATTKKCSGDQPCPVSPGTKTNLGSSTLDLKPKIRCDDHWRCSAPIKVNQPFAVHCNCWEYCGIYGDCCYDVPLLDNKTSEPRSKSNFACVNPFPTPDVATLSYFMVADCPSTWKDREIEQLCTSIDFDNVYQTLPVTSRESYLTYRNVYCSLCNNITQNIVFWKVKFSLHNCSSKITNASLVEILNVSDVIGHIPPKDTFPNDFFDKSVRFCSANFSSDCPRNTDTDTRLKCKRYFAPVEVQVANSSVLYKNEFCAFCNGHSAASLRCPDSMSVFDTARNWSDQDDWHYFSGGYDPADCDGGFHVLTEERPGAGFQRLIDIDFSVRSDPVAKCEDGYAPVKWTLANKAKSGSRDQVQCVKTWKKKRGATRH